MTTLEKIRNEIEEERVHADWDFGQEIYYNNAIDDVLKIIDKYAEQEPKTGRWIATEDYETLEINGYFCSVCDLPMETEEKTNFCPNCGAKMKARNKE